MNTTIHQEIDIAMSPAQVYDALLDESDFSDRTGGSPTKIDRSPGGAFSCFGGRIVGRLLELVPARRIVQAWRAKSWAEGVYSIVRFEFSVNNGGVRITLDHTGFPVGEREHLEKGWHENYWAPLKAALEQ